jgi:hypothetical protein
MEIEGTVINFSVNGIEGYRGPSWTLEIKPKRNESCRTSQSSSSSRSTKAWHTCAPGPLGKL